MNLPVKNINFVANQAIFRILGSTPDRELAFAQQVGIDWLSQVAPHDNYGKIKVKWYKIGPYQRTISVPQEAFFRTTRVLMKCGDQVYSLTVDPNLMLPSGITFQCDPNEGATIDNYWPDGTFGSLRPNIAQNTNYYRINDGMLTFAQVPPEGHLVIEYLSSAGGDEESLVHEGYLESLRLYMTWQYWEYKNNVGRAKDFERQYNEQQTIANVTVKCPKMDEILDILSI